jgi:hypothetical protein
MPPSRIAPHVLERQPTQLLDGGLGARGAPARVAVGVRRWLLPHLRQAVEGGRDVDGVEVAAALLHDVHDAFDVGCIHNPSVDLTVLEDVEAIVAAARGDRGQLDGGQATWMWHRLGGPTILSLQGVQTSPSGKGFAWFQAAPGARGKADNSAKLGIKLQANCPFNSIVCMRPSCAPCCPSGPPTKATPAMINAKVKPCERSGKRPRPTDKRTKV